MSFKAKDLQFDSSQPAFLQRLRGQLQSGDTARHEHPIARNKRMKKDDDEDDAPTYVIEETNQSLSKEEYEALVSGKDSKEKEGKEDESVAGDAQQNATTEAESRPKDKIAEVGGNAKKRKAAKIIGDDQGNSKDEADKDSEKPAAKTTKKPKKKAKAVKLTFGDEDEG